MKNFFTILSALLITAILVPSCGVSVVKRQHRNGYYISTNSRQHRSSDAKSDVAKTENNRSEEKLNKNTAIVVPSETVKSGNQPSEIRPETTGTEVVTAQNAPEAKTAKAHKSASADKTIIRKPHLNGKVATAFLDKMPKTQKMETKIKSVQEGGAGARGDGLSLFWIVILILLILYVFGVTGRWFPGGLIHVLLVIALVLLILWLLGII